MARGIEMCKHQVKLIPRKQKHYYGKSQFTRLYNDFSLEQNICNQRKWKCIKFTTENTKSKRYFIILYIPKEFPLINVFYIDKNILSWTASSYTDTVVYSGAELVFRDGLVASHGKLLCLKGLKNVRKMHCRFI